jgi:hypothetical protein
MTKITIRNLQKHTKFGGAVNRTAIAKIKIWNARNGKNVFA